MNDDQIEVEIELTGERVAPSVAAPTSTGERPVTSGYRLLVGLGGGGMGQVFLAEAAGLAGFRKLVVIKQLRTSLAHAPDFLTMFLEEAKLAARLNHPNVVQTNEVGRDEAGNYFIAMEYLEGQPLNRIWRRRDRAELGLAFDLQVIVQILRGLEYAHQLADFDGRPLQVVHRDVSPHNIFVTYDGAVKLIDFGIAKVADSRVETQEGMYRGKLRYASPEQIAGDKVDARTDLYSLGVVLWEALTGQNPWTGVANVDVASKVVLGEGPDVDQVAPAAPAELRRICKKAMQRRRDERYASAAEMRIELEAYLASSPGSPRQLGEAVSKAFAQERVEMARKVDEQLKIPNLPWLGRESKAIPVPIVEHRSGSASASMVAPPPTSRPLVLALLAALLVIGLLIGMLLGRPAAPAPAPASAPLAAPVAQPALLTQPPTVVVTSPPAPVEAPAADSPPATPAEQPAAPEGDSSANAAVPERAPAKAGSKVDRSHPKPAARTKDKKSDPAHKAIEIIQDPTVEIIE